MDIEQTIRDLNEMYPYWPIVAATATGIVGYTIGLVHGISKGQATDRTITSPRVEETDDSYQSRTISEAKLTGKDSTITGVVEDFHIDQNGYSGIISDVTGRVPFSIDREPISLEQEGLVPVLLRDSKEKKTPLKMEGAFSKDDKLFLTEVLEHRLDGEVYKI